MVAKVFFYGTSGGLLFGAPMFPLFWEVITPRWRYPGASAPP